MITAILVKDLNINLKKSTLKHNLSSLTVGESLSLQHTCACHTLHSARAVPHFQSVRAFQPTLE
jgi:hypothetical protein